MTKGSLFILIFISSINLVSAQNATHKRMSDSTYTVAVKEYNNSYQFGLYEKCISEIQDLLSSARLSKNQVEVVLEIEAKAYIEIGNTDQAEEVVKSILNNNPHYELKEFENSEGFSRIVKKYEHHPLFSIGIRNTANWNWFPTTKIFSVLDGMNYNSPYDGPKGFGFFYYGWMEYEFIRSVSINVEGIYFYTSYSRNLNKDPGISLYFSERLNFSQLPVSVRKYFSLTKNILYYGAIGGAYLRMTKAIASTNITVKDTTRYLNNINMLPMRNVNTWQLIFGVGIGYQIKNLRLFLDARYFAGLSSLSNSSTRNQNSTLIKDFYYIDNSFKLNQFELGASVSYTLFNSVKKISH
jgi:hypothetical protein